MPRSLELGPATPADAGEESVEGFAESPGF